MDPIIGGSLIGAGASLAGGLMGSHSSSKARQHAKEMADAEYWRQKEFASMGIQWRVQDARAAGIHPVFAMQGGGAAYAPQPISVGGDNSVGDAIASSGQSIGRAVAASQTPEQRMGAMLDLEIKREQLRGLGIENDAKARVGHGAQVGPGMPSSSIPGDMFAGDWSTTSPAQRVSHDTEDHSSTASAPSPFFEKFTVGDTDGGTRTVWLPSGGKGTATEALESLSESWPMMYGVLSENMRRDPELVYKLRHLWPGGEMAGDVAKWLERKMQMALNYKKGRHAAHEMARENMRVWNRSGRERGVNWR